MDDQITAAEAAGAAVYTPGFLRFYDLAVLGFNNFFVWRCPTPNLLQQYNNNVTGNHLDIGPGTGYMLARARFPTTDSVTVALIDLNPSPLQAASAVLRARGIEPTTHEGSVLRPLPLSRQVTSAAASLLMHCVPGSWAEKGVAFQHIANVVTDDGVFFGSTVLESPSTVVSRAVGSFFRSRGAFHNGADDEPGLRRALEAAWSEVTVSRVGQLALWTARGPKRTP
ncbi:SAM-dependent methyltransferase [Nocardia salmonicida]|uniref:SAM-dependent methyltransferase n=1 Tax=Nocardia salmonicida TaxID=53431 RepID=UPI00378BFAE5